MTEPRRSSAGGRFARLALLALALLLLFATHNRRDRIVGLNTPIRFDDFAYVVLNTKRAEAGRHPVYLVTVQVQNNAKRVDYRYERGHIYLSEADGRTYRPAGAATAPAVVLKAGARHTETLTFDVPADLREPSLRVTFGPVGDTLESLFLGRQRVKLP
jgi:hypothetical protein